MNQRVKKYPGRGTAPSSDSFASGEGEPSEPHLSACLLSRTTLSTGCMPLLHPTNSIKTLIDQISISWNFFHCRISKNKDFWTTAYLQQTTALSLLKRRLSRSL